MSLPLLFFAMLLGAYCNTVLSTFVRFVHCLLRTFHFWSFVQLRLFASAVSSNEIASCRVECSDLFFVSRRKELIMAPSPGFAAARLHALTRRARTPRALPRPAPPSGAALLTYSPPPPPHAAAPHDCAHARTHRKPMAARTHACRHM